MSNTVDAQLRIIIFALSEAKRLSACVLPDDGRKRQLREVVVLLERCLDRLEDIKRPVGGRPSN